MDEEKRLVCGLVSQLLTYPDENSLLFLPEIEETAEDISAGLKERVREFLLYLGKTPLIALQEEYTGTFDLNSDVCLNLTFHKWGDDKQRSSALVALKEIYRDGGYEIAGGELPDYLPMLLEFLSVCSEDSRFSLYEEYGDQLALVASRLREMQSPYAKLLEVLQAALRR
ncbi:MAG: nitrate reductase molybdenum cofactor assembly chaperone [Syntrophobacteraceae bacterium]